MRRRVLSGALGAAALTAACTVGPKYRADTVIPPSERIGAPALSDSSRRFFD